MQNAKCKMQNAKLKEKVIILGETPTILHFAFSILHFALCAINPNLLTSRSHARGFCIKNKMCPCTSILIYRGRGDPSPTKNNILHRRGGVLPPALQILICRCGRFVNRPYDV